MVQEVKDITVEAEGMVACRVTLRDSPEDEDGLVIDKAYMTRLENKLDVLWSTIRVQDREIKELRQALACLPVLGPDYKTTKKKFKEKCKAEKSEK